MKKCKICAVAVAIGLAFSGGVMAQTMSKDEYLAGRNDISADFKTAKKSCNSFSGNTKDKCKVEAVGKERIAKAELEFRYKPTDRNRYEAQITKAQADYSMAKEQCDDEAGNKKDVCMKQAKAQETAAKADAKANMKITGANKTANQKSNAAYMKAGEKAVDARKDAADDKSDADFSVAKEKCDVYSGDAKDLCIKDAKAQFGKS